MKFCLCNCGKEVTKEKNKYFNRSHAATHKNSLGLIGFKKGNELGKLMKGRIKTKEEIENIIIGVKKAKEEGKIFGYQKGHKLYEGSEKGWFKKEQIPWNKGLISFNSGEKNGKWKGGLPNCKICSKQINYNCKYCNNCKIEIISIKNKGKIKTKETKLKISNTLIKKYNSGEIIQPMIGKNYPKEKYPNFGMRNKKVSDISKEKMKYSHLGKKLSEEHKNNISKSAIIHMEKVGRTYLTPNIGIKEKEILNKLEEELQLKIIRQYRIGKYFVDGYCKEKNIVYEIDEKFHQKQLEKDLERQKYIKEKLKCEVFRICV